MYNLFLDDTRNPVDVYEYTFRHIYLDIDWVIVRSYDEFVQMIKTFGLPEKISFDHDLGLEHYDHQHDEPGKLPYDQYTEKTGYHCAKWLIDHCMDNKLELPKTILIHSMNVIGSQNIASLFNTYEKIYGK
jgi:hypothetical protein